MIIRSFTLVALFCSLFSSGIYAQFLIGPKAGGIYNWSRYKNPTPFTENSIDSKNMFGYNFGGVLIYSLTKQVAFHTEIIYARKEKVLQGGARELFSHNAIYNYLEVPILLKYSFQRKYYKWYLQAGANFAYWINGKGRVKSFEYDEVGIEAYDYKIIFVAASETNESSDIFVGKANRVQLGLDFGFGAFFNTFHPKHKFMVDVRFQYGHSWLADDNFIDVGLDEYYEDLQSAFSGISVGIGYLLAYDMGQGRKGKSTDKQTQKIKIKGVRKK